MKSVSAATNSSSRPAKMLCRAAPADGHRIFEPDLDASNLKLLKKGVSEMEAAIMRMRKNRADINL